MTVDPKCPSCKEEPQTVEHWLQRCPNAVALRQQLFGEPFLPLSVLTTNPGSVLALAKKTLLEGLLLKHQTSRTWHGMQACAIYHGL